MLTCEESDAAVGVYFLTRRNRKFLHAAPTMFATKLSRVSITASAFAVSLIATKTLKYGPALHLPSPSHQLTLLSRTRFASVRCLRHFSKIELTDRRAAQTKAHECNATGYAVNKTGEVMAACLIYPLKLSVKAKREEEKKDLSNIF